MARLTNADKHILKFPPTPETWLCKGCEIPLAGSNSECWYCHALKPARPKKLWPTYVAACTKAGHTPGEKWHPTPVEPKPPRVARPVRRKVG